MSIYSELISEQGPLIFEIQGKSMEPFLKEGDKVQISSFTSLKPGQCYLYKFNNKLTLHRLAYKGAGYLCFIGDNSNNFENVTMDQICGVNTGKPDLRIAGLLVTILNLFYLLIHKLPFYFADLLMAKFRRKAIKIVYRSFYEKRVS